MDDFNSQRIDVESLTRKVDDLFKGNRDLILGFSKFLPKQYQITLPIGNKSRNEVFEEVTFRTEEKRSERERVDKSDNNKECCTPSYVLRTKNNQTPCGSERTGPDAQVLNDDCEQRVESYSCKFRHKNLYEQKLFECEDDKFEQDTLLESVKSANACAEKLLEEISIEDHFSVLNLRCIERLYGDHGLDMIDALRENVLNALPVILNHLKQKQEEVATSRVEFDKVWTGAFAENYHKSLNCRGFV
ncbi:hypothetical protein UlMin_041993 [Ulmus minor]